MSSLDLLLRREEVVMSYKVSIRQMEPQTALTVRGQTKPADIAPFFGQAIGKVYQRLAKSGAVPVGPPVAVYHSFTEDSVDMEVGLPIQAPVPGEGEVQPSELPGGAVAVTVHQGSYDQLRAAWDALGQWVQEQGHESNGPCWESYTTDPGQEKDPAKWVTELYWPVK